MSDDAIYGLFFILFFTAFLVAFALLIRWAYLDAKFRGKSPVLVCIAVIFFFPWGWIAWLLFRPDPKPPDQQVKSFDLQNYRVQ